MPCLCCEIEETALTDSMRTAQDGVLPWVSTAVERRVVWRLRAQTVLRKVFTTR
eukprot:COSAG02_NODE_70189_length_197_cov_24.285714_1_plen_53_part_01